MNTFQMRTFVQYPVISPPPPPRRHFQATQRIYQIWSICYQATMAPARLGYLIIVARPSLKSLGGYLPNLHSRLSHHL